MINILEYYKININSETISEIQEFALHTRLESERWVNNSLSKIFNQSLNFLMSVDFKSKQDFCKGFLRFLENNLLLTIYVRCKETSMIPERIHFWIDRSHSIDNFLSELSESGYSVYRYSILDFHDGTGTWNTKIF